uniref:Uncharacterized protein n=1 Tax=Cairina moschata TaxID=8855 RepID=A0A8C3BA42_CAIMO
RACTERLHCNLGLLRSQLCQRYIQAAAPALLQQNQRKKSPGSMHLLAKDAQPPPATYSSHFSLSSLVMMGFCHFLTRCRSGGKIKCSSPVATQTPGQAELSRTEAKHQPRAIPANTARRFIYPCKQLPWTSRSKTRPMP